MNPDTKDGKADSPAPDSPTIGSNSTSPEQDAPVDALSRTPDELEEEQAAAAAAAPQKPVDQTPEKKASGFRRLLRKINPYFLIFILILIIAGIVAVVTYLNSQKPPEETAIAGQELTSEALKQLANTDASVGNSNQTLTIQGNAIIEGQTLMRGNLNVAGNFQTGGSIQSPSITISGEANLGTAQANSLQVATTLAVQGGTTVRDLSVAGPATFNGPLTAQQITTSRLILSGTATLEIPNHISFTGPSPSHSINGGALGNGGSASVSGSDTAGTVNVNTGNNPAAGCFVRINFNRAYSKQPHVIISPVGAAAGRTQYYVDRDNSGFSICASSPAPNNQAFAFDYFVTY